MSPVGGLGVGEPAQRHGHRPQPGESQPFHPKRGRRSQAGGGAGFVTVNDRLFAPLAGLNPNDVTQGGYSWLSVTDGGMTYHPGVDLNAGGSCNADEGNPVVAPLAGVVQSTLYAASGEGNHLWFEVDDPCCPGPTWMHVDHLQRIDVAVGQRVPAGGHLGTCGRTGGWDCSHLHTEFVKGRPQSFWMWPYGWSRAQVEDTYYQPLSWWQAATALVLAEGNEPIPPEAIAMLTDFQVRHWIMPSLWEWARIPFNPDSGTANAWVRFLREGKYLGRPRTEERPYGEGDEAGVWVEHDYGLLLYRFRDDEASITG